MNDDFELLDLPGGPIVRLRFRGRLNNEPVEWDATIMTLAAAGAEESFIEIAEPGPGGQKLTVALPFPAITLPTVRKTVVMIRNYKRLRPGRHVYGTKLR